jgi:hypothetical protein
VGLETATYIAGLNESWPDGNDQRTTVDNHARLIKAAMKRTWTMLDGAVNVSAGGFNFLADLSKSVQYQLNQLRDGSSTVLNAMSANYASSASTALNAGMIGGVSLSDIAALSRTNTYLAVNIFGASTVGSVRLFPGSSALPGYVSFHTPEGTRRGFIGFGDGNSNLQIQAENGWRWEFAGSLPLYESLAMLHAGSTLNADNIGTGTIPNARISLAAVQQHQASLNVNSALTATSATTATTASNANNVGGYGVAITPTAGAVAVRNVSGDLFARFFNTGAPIENVAADAICYTSGSDGYIRRCQLGYLGAQFETRNITGRSGISKSLASGSGPPSLVGTTNGDLFYYY